MNSPTETARLAFVAHCAYIGSHHLVEEGAILHGGREYLPACAIAVLDKTAGPTAEYYDWLRSQSAAAYDSQYRLELVLVDDSQYRLELVRV